MKVEEKIVSIMAIVFIVMLFITAFTFIIFYYTDSATALKDAWSTLGGFFGGIATLTTGYIAFMIFDGWKIQHNKQLNNHFNMKIYEQFINLDNLILEYGLLTVDLTPPKNEIISFFQKKI